MEETSQQLEEAEPQSDWFTERRLPDDVTLKFDDGKELFASRGLLMCASLVFEAKFKHDKKEKETNVVEMSGKNYDHFLELLKCVHPWIAKPITYENVFYLVELTHLYKMNGLLQRCHDVLRKVILHIGTLRESDFQLSIPMTKEAYSQLKLIYSDSSHGMKDEKIFTANRILKVLSTADMFQDVFESLIDEAIDKLSNISVIYYDKIGIYNYKSDKKEIILKQNKEMFDQLDSVLRARISRARLDKLE